MPPIWRPRFPVRDALDRWVLKASLSVGLRLPLEQREEIADQALEAAEAVVLAAMQAELDQQASIDRDIENARRARERHVAALRARREGDRYDRERGLA